VVLYRFADFMPISISVHRYARMLPVFMERVWIPALRRFMADKGWNQATLAEESGVRPNTISDTLKGTNSGVDTMSALAKALGVPLWALFCTDREYALFSEQVKKEDIATAAKLRQDEVRAAVQAELAPLMDSIVAKLTGQPEAPPANPLAARPVLAKGKGRGRKKSA
jgi:transcriptional regulator with XRE-family HTH domain